MERKWKGLPIVIFGVGGFAKEIKTLIEDINYHTNVEIFDLVGFVSNNTSDIGKEIEGIKVVSSNEYFSEYCKDFSVLGVSIALGNPIYKEKIEKDVLASVPNIVFPNLIHPKANIPNSKTNNLGTGTIICAGVTITTNIKIGKFVTVNINSTIGHDVIIEDYSTINPLASISGNVYIEKGSLIGAGASILEKINIGENSIVGLGAIAVKNVEKGTIVICKAAQRLEK